jgi:DNA-binding beta-propeller fold protein YncE
MKKCSLAVITVLLLFIVNIHAQDAAPLKLIDTFKFPSAVKGHFDHFGVDLQGSRLFATPEDYKSVVVFDLKTGKLIHTISGITRPRAILYRDDLKRIYVTDGGAGDLKIFDGKTYSLLKSIKLLEDADSIGYDPATHYLYVENGGAMFIKRTRC